MDRATGDKFQRPFEGEGEKPDDEVQDLEKGDRGNGAVEVFSEEVPEDLWPEESFYCCDNLVLRGSVGMV